MAEQIDDYEREYSYEQKDFEQVKSRIYSHAGIALADHKKDLVYNRLVRRIRELQVESFSDYLTLLDSSSDEMSQFVNAMTTNLTSFYREAHHFEFLSNTYIPELFDKGQRSLRIWSFVRLIMPWRLPAWPALTLPFAVSLKRFFAPDLVFIFGISVS